MPLLIFLALHLSLPASATVQTLPCGPRLAKGFVPSKILLIDKDPTHAKKLIDNLRRNNHEVLHVSDVLVWSRNGMGFSPEIVIFDLGARFDYDLVNRGTLILQKAHPKIGIIVLCESKEEADFLLAYAVGADQYIATPYPFRLIALKIHALEKRMAGEVSAISPPVPVSLHGVTVDDWRKRALFKDQDSGLTATEFRILQTLFQRPGHCFDHTNFEKAEEPLTAAALRTHVKLIRRKMDAAGLEGDDLIQTRPTRGYSFKEP